MFFCSCHNFTSIFLASKTWFADFFVNRTILTTKKQSFKYNLFWEWLFSEKHQCSWDTKPYLKVPILLSKPRKPLYTSTVKEMHFRYQKSTLSLHYPWRICKNDIWSWNYQPIDIIHNTAVKDSVLPEYYQNSSEKMSPGGIRTHDK